METLHSQMRDGFTTAYIDRLQESNVSYRPQFIFNDYQSGRKVLAYLEHELNHADEFFISVAFITMGGITPLLQTLSELEKKGISGKVLTTNYLNFSEPQALKKLASFKNIEVRMYWSEANRIGFHTKGYVFRQGKLYRMIIGSSNLTLSALTKNEEWNTKIVATEDGEHARQILYKFNDLWQHKNTLGFEDFFEKYINTYNIIKEHQETIKKEKIVELELYKLQPNSMQVQFVSNIKKLIENGAQKALLISATGTGKTYASAFVVKDRKPLRVLFLVHREQIAKQAQKSYRQILGKEKSFGILSGTAKDVDADYIFSTIQTMAKIEVFQRFAPDHFDMIIIDEVHRAAANTYQSIMGYFKPQFWLGMTASPDRMDGYDIYGLFDHNIAYEIRLEKALEEDLLCPFHYFGITDFEVDGEIYQKENVRSFEYLTDDKRVEHILDKVNYYGYSGKRVKGLVFCSRNEEAKVLSGKFNEKGFSTVSLSGNDLQSFREDVIDRLVNDERQDFLDYVFTVDIFNEGVDIPEINQVIMLRPTQSTIVFVQQLGRGLRKAEQKEYVVILDFIGNYIENNYMIPMALSGDRSYNKDNIRRCLLEGSKIIPGASTIHFDEIARKQIFKSIDAVNLNDVKKIKENYNKLRHKLGRIPLLSDFDQYGEMDIVCMFRNKTLGSYYKFLCKYEKAYDVRLNKLEELYIEFISTKFAEGKRIHELEVLNILLSQRENILKTLEDHLCRLYGKSFKRNTRKNIIHIMTNQFATGSGKLTYKDCIFLTEDGDDYKISSRFAECLKNPAFVSIVKELVDFGCNRYIEHYSDTYQDGGFVLYKKYEYEDVCRILEWDQNIVPLNIGGYKYDSVTRTFPVFINYDKSSDIKDTIRYEDRFQNTAQLISISKNKRTTESDDVQRFIHAAEEGISVDLFVRKNKDDKIAKSFYYLGRMETYKQENFIMENTKESAVRLYWNISTPVREDIYDYLTEMIDEEN